MGIKYGGKECHVDPLLRWPRHNDASLRDHHFVLALPLQTRRIPQRMKPLAQRRIGAVRIAQQLSAE
jgi:hypothetical protein